MPEKYTDPIFAQALKKHLQEASIKYKEMVELAKGVIAIRDKADNYTIYFNMAKWIGPVKISVSTKTRIGRVLGVTRIPPVRNFTEALELAKKEIKGRRNDRQPRWINIKGEE